MHLFNLLTAPARLVSGEGLEAHHRMQIYCISAKPDIVLSSLEHTYGVYKWTSNLFWTGALLKSELEVQKGTGHFLDWCPFEIRAGGPKAHRS